MYAAYQWPHVVMAASPGRPASPA